MESDDARLPAMRPSSVPAELMRSAVSPLAGPMLAAEIMQATASAMTQAMTVMMRPWLTGVSIAPPVQQWSGLGVEISYTHLEVRRPLP